MRGFVERVIGQARRRGSIAQLPFALAVEAQLNMHLGFLTPHEPRQVNRLRLRWILVS